MDSGDFHLVTLWFRFGLDFKIVPSFQYFSVFCVFAHLQKWNRSLRWLYSEWRWRCGNNRWPFTGNWCADRNRQPGSRLSFGMRMMVRERQRLNYSNQSIWKLTIKAQWKLTIKALSFILQMLTIKPKSICQKAFLKLTFNSFTIPTIIPLN